MFYKKNFIDIIKETESSMEGLSSSEADKRLREQGFNELKEGSKVPLWKMFLESFKDPLVIILLIAAIVQVFLGEWVESLIIFLVVILNSILGVTQTRKAESSLNSLKKLSSPNAKVLRDGNKITLPVREVVVGDVVFLEAGDYIPADGRLIEAQSLKVVEGMITGEAEAVMKHTDVIIEEVGIGDQRNMVFSGTTVVYGRGKLVVTHTGMNTEVGKVATLLETAGTKSTPLQQKLDDFGKKLGIFIMILAAVIFGIQVFRGYISGND
ncbi:MAG: HAD-IC family P-type ATPase, partial [Clostridium sp.]